MTDTPDNVLEAPTDASDEVEAMDVDVDAGLVSECVQVEMQLLPPLEKHTDDGLDDVHSLGSDSNNDDKATNYDELIKEHKRQEADTLDKAICEETEKVHTRVDCGEVMVDGAISNESLQSMKSLYVTDAAGNIHHKGTLLKNINMGRSLTKSFDRQKRVRDEARSGYSSSGTAVNSAVTRAFMFSHDTSARSNSGLDRHNFG
jgi:hypothetical protein